jgi:putative ATP-dependent endonuclease of OLD family
MNANGGKLPIENGIDVISVGTAFLRFLEVAEKLNKSISVVTDNDGDVAAVQTKYVNYIGANVKANIVICFDSTVDSGALVIGAKNKPFNYNTLEPKILKENGRAKMNTILGTAYANDDDLHKYMKANKTECALKIFETTEEIKFPQYILDAIA